MNRKDRLFKEKNFSVRLLMKSFLKFLLCSYLVFLSSPLLAEDDFSAQMTALASSVGSGEPVEVRFSDNYVQNIYGPIRYYKDPNAPTLRCPCYFYILEYRDENGRPQTRRIKQEPSGATWTGEDGREFGVASAQLPGTNSDGEPELAQTCQQVGNYEKLYIHSRKLIAHSSATSNSCPINGTLSCLGETITKCSVHMRCDNDPDFGTDIYSVTCLAVNNSCPTDIKECAFDEALDNQISVLEGQGFDLNESRNPGAGVQQ